jgi:hypothetical protein
MIKVGCACTTIHKPNNPTFYKQGGVDSSLRTAQLTSQRVFVQVPANKKNSTLLIGRF